MPSDILQSFQSIHLTDEPGVVGPPLIPANFSPQTSLIVKFGGKAPINPGEELNPEEAKTQPEISVANVSDLDASLTYSIILVDPDAPTPLDRKFSPWRHWVASGSLNADEKTLKLTTEPATSFLGPGPMSNTGFHRYTFLLFQHHDSGTILADAVGGHEFAARRAWNLSSFVKGNGLKLVAATWFKCRNAEDKLNGVEWIEGGGIQLQ